MTFVDMDGLRKLEVGPGNAPYEDEDFLWATYLLETDYYGDKFWELIDAGGGPRTALDAAVETWRAGEDWLDKCTHN